MLNTATVARDSWLSDAPGSAALGRTELPSEYVVPVSAASLDRKSIAGSIITVHEAPTGEVQVVARGLGAVPEPTLGRQPVVVFLAKPPTAVFVGWHLAL